jgi:hypothetical protein
MMGMRLKRFSRWIAEHGATIIAISSLGIALASIYLTIQAQKDDRTYRELMIRPSIAIRAYSHDFSVSFANDGLGPAEIEDIAYRFDDECIGLLDADGKYNRTAIEKARNGIFKRLFTDIFSFNVPGAETTAITTRDLLLLPKSIIAAGKEHRLFSVSESSLPTLRSKLDALDHNFAQSLMDRFVGLAFTLPVSMKYCSMSGGYCRVAAQEDEKGQTCPLRASDPM